MSVRSRSHAELSWIFTAALNDDRGKLITLLSELSEQQLKRIADAAQLIDEEAQDYGNNWHGWAENGQAVPE